MDGDKLIPLFVADDHSFKLALGAICAAGSTGNFLFQIRHRYCC